MKKRKILIDCDPGVDDAVMLAFTAANQDRLDILGVTTVSGNQEIEKVTKNAQVLTEYFGLKVQVAKGASCPMVREAVYAPEIHGENGLGNCELPCVHTQPAKENAVLFMKDILDALEEGEKATLVATGPLTNVALLLKVFPEVREKLHEIVFMGGSLSGGNVTDAAEFNFYVDPEAARIVLRSGLPLVMCGLDVTEECTLSRKQILKMCQWGSPAAKLCGDMLGYCLENSSEKYRGEVSVHDVVPVMYLLYPELFEGGHKILDADCSEGISRGAVTGGFRWWKNETEDTNAYVLTGADKKKFQEYLITSLFEHAQ